MFCFRADRRLRQRELRLIVGVPRKFKKGEVVMSNEHTSNRQAQGQRQWSKLAERACKDTELKRRLLDDPAPLLREAGIEVPAGAEVRVTEEHGSLNCVIEAGKAAGAAAGGELAEADLANVAGGSTRPTGKAPMVYMRYTMTNVSLH